MNNKGVTPIWLRQVATALSSRFNVSVREGRGWSINIEKRVLFYKAEHLLALDRDTCLGILLHELGHLHFTSNNWTKTAKLYKDKSLSKIAFNAVNAYEDVRINEKMSQAYGGSRELIDAMNELLGGDGVRNILEMNKSIKDGLRQRQNADMAEWFEVFYVSMAKLLGQFPQFMPEAYYDPEKLTTINEIVAEALKRDLKNLDTTQEVYDFVEEFVFPRIAKYLPKTPQSGEGEGQGGEGTSETESDDGESNSEADGESEEGESPATGNSGGGEEEKPEEPPVPKEEQGSSDSPHGTQDEWKKELENKIKKAIVRGRINPDEDQRTKPFDQCSQQHLYKACDTQKHEDESKNLQRKFANKFEALFRNNEYARYTGNQRSGRLDKRSLSKFALGKTRLFKRKLEINKKSYGVALCLDMSGSMYEKRLRGSFHAMFAFSNTLQKLKIPYGIGFFSHMGIIGKHFASKVAVNKKLTETASSVYNGGTNPSSLLKQLIGIELVNQNVDKKIAVILTDGEWSHGGYDTLRELKKKHKDILFYIVALDISRHNLPRIEEELDGVATLLTADEPEDIVERYIEIAKKHLL